MNSIPMIEQVAGKGAARAAARKRGIKSSYRRPSWVTYVLLTVVLLISAYPLYFAFLLASSDAPTIAQNPVPSLMPEGKFFANIKRVLEADIQFWGALWNSIIVSVVTAASVVIFSTLSGYSFAKLRFRG